MSIVMYNCNTDWQFQFQQKVFLNKHLINLDLINSKSKPFHSVGLLLMCSSIPNTYVRVMEHKLKSNKYIHN